jgi:hypothetical protein
VPNGDDQDEEDIILDVVYRGVLANPEAIETVAAAKLPRTSRSWISGEAVYGSLNSKALREYNSGERLLGLTAQPDLVLLHQIRLDQCGF